MSIKCVTLKLMDIKRGEKNKKGRGGGGGGEGEILNHDLFCEKPSPFHWRCLWERHHLLLRV